MARPAVHELVFMGRVTEAAAPVQDSKANRLDMAIKVIRVIREVTTIRGISNNSNRVIRAIQSS